MMHATLQLSTYSPYSRARFALLKSKKKTTIIISFTGLKKLFLSFSPFSLADLMAIFQVDLG